MPVQPMTSSSFKVRQTDAALGELVSRRVDQLRPHPCLTKLKIVPTAQELSRGATLSEHLTITQDNYILSGHARWENARRQRCSSLPCLQFQMTVQQALLWILEKHQGSPGLNDYNRIVIALELEPWLRSCARTNQQTGGHFKASSNLTEADRLDVRAEVAKAANVSVGNVSTVKKLLERAGPDVLKALREGEVSIPRAGSWLKGSGNLTDQLSVYRNLRMLDRAINTRLRGHLATATTIGREIECRQVASALARLSTDQETSVVVRTAKIPGQVLILSTELLESIERQGRLSF